ncbi:ABC transporter permease [Sinorhizobium fredii USDA 205]|uniref:ABC transporter permease subunit n=1 Tax=Rhizobium fredii TaxID=380 RepID=A0A844ADR3_RHIFR|nr:ABC transporter permease [Sinorhizobium fredii]ASY72684.1 Ribose ABC transport system, permease protein RbsC [Sinorhizobium fredii CCBAU 83666]AWM28823.1 Ribose ABC transport system permease protein RbsC [Sinorhizobium fredii CCBAU 25509]KSV83436.1 ABC transporter permease [Sinorhizobium fredii USDA 205]MCG5473763.1 ABC transporter permease [Sinorhizobium fredii]MQW97158.1 ABC transporter permease subunit [Sinorhizobium fredii]
MLSRTDAKAAGSKIPAGRLTLTDFDLTLPALGLLVLFFVVPVAILLARSVSEPVPGFGNYAELLGSSTYLRIFANTFLVSGLVTFVSLLIGFPVAWALAVMPSRFASVVFAILLLSMWTNLLARTYAWMVLLQRTGVINKVLIGLGLIDKPLPLVNNLTGVTIGMTYIMLPFIILPLYGVIRKIDPAILQAAALCGANRWQSLVRVLLPLAMPGMAAGALMVFVMSLGYFVTPALLGGTANMMLAELIAQFVQSLVNWGMGGAAALVLLVVTLALYAVQLRFFGTDRMGGR